MSLSDPVAALSRFGYDPIEAAFLSLAALQSGFFLRRQYLYFTGTAKGWRDVVLLEKLQANRHCQATTYRHGRQVHHLSAKPLYQALGEVDNRNRREHQPSTVQNRIMGLDYVLAHPGRRYLLTEREKVDYFVRECGIAVENLPVRRFASPRGGPESARHFVEKYPLSVAVASDGGETAIHFGYIDEGLQSTDRFESFLGGYGSLLRQLPASRVVYVAQDARLFEKARVLFCREMTHRETMVEDADSRARHEYFELRREYEQGDFSRFDTPRLIHYRTLKSRFAHVDDAYTAWLHGETARLRPKSSVQNDDGDRSSARFSTHRLEHDYSLFGTLTGAIGAARGGRRPNGGSHG